MGLGDARHSRLAHRCDVEASDGRVAGVVGADVSVIAIDSGAALAASTGAVVIVGAGVRNKSSRSNILLCLPILIILILYFNIFTNLFSYNNYPITHN